MNKKDVKTEQLAEMCNSGAVAVALIPVKAVAA